MCGEEEEAVCRSESFHISAPCPRTVTNARPGHSGAVSIASKGWKQALADGPNLANGLNGAFGKVTYDAVARDPGCKLSDVSTFLR